MRGLLEAEVTVFKNTDILAPVRDGHDHIKVINFSGFVIADDGYTVRVGMEPFFNIFKGSIIHMVM